MFAAQRLHILLDLVDFLLVHISFVFNFLAWNWGADPEQVTLLQKNYSVIDA